MPKRFYIGRNIIYTPCPLYKYFVVQYLKTYYGGFLSNNHNALNLSNM